MQAEGVQPMVSPDDTFLAEEVVLKSAEVQKLLLSRYGISDMSEVVCDPWYYGDRCGESHDMHAEDDLSGTCQL